jgi:hypothetical protein
MTEVTRAVSEAEELASNTTSDFADAGGNISPHLSVAKSPSKVGPALLGLALLGAGLGGGFVLGRSSKKATVVSSKEAAVAGKEAGNIGAASTDMAATFRAEVTGDYETYWSYLYPSQQAKIDKNVFVKCVTQERSPDVPTVRALDEYDQIVDLGVADQKAKVVTIHFKGKQGASTRIAYTLFADGKWRWLLGEKELAAYASGKCV